MLEITFTDSIDTHRCEAVEEGEWIIFSCPYCADFRRKMNRQTGEWITEQAGDPTIRHQGMYTSPVLNHFDHSPS